MQHYKSARRLATLIQLLHPTAELRQQVKVLRTFESRAVAGLTPLESTRPTGPIRNRRRRLRNAPAVIILIVLNLIAFAIELRFGAWTNLAVLHRLGALEPRLVTINGEYWRLLTALFLHAGVVHLLVNLFALYVLGPPLERAIGSLRFVACYLISGLGSGAGVVALSALNLIEANELVGASGSVMGIVGAWAGFLLRHRHTPLARKRLNDIVIIVVIQSVFDILTPQVSMSAHLCGLVTGFLIGLVIGPRAQPQLREAGEIDPNRLRARQVPK